LPAWDEEVILETWPSGIRRFIYDRDLQLKDHEGNALVDVTTSWMLIDLAKRA